MIVKKYETREEWMAARQGKITGSTLKDTVVLRGDEEKIGFYKLIASRLAVEDESEAPMDRGTRLESEALQEFTEITGTELCTDLVIWQRDDNLNIAISPDGYVDEPKIVEAVEVKCLNSAEHIKAKITGKIPSQYDWQKLQYFIVNSNLEMLHFVFHDPRFIPELQTHIITIHRHDIAVEIEKYLSYEINMLKRVDEWVLKLSS